MINLLEVACQLAATTSLGFEIASYSSVHVSLKGLIGLPLERFSRDDFL